MAMNRTFRNVVALAAGVAVAALVLEGGSRLLGRPGAAPGGGVPPIAFVPADGSVVKAPPAAANSGDLHTIHTIDQWTWWRVKPGLVDYRVLSEWNQRSFTLHTDAQGFRRKGSEPAEVSLRIFAAGDSTTFGVGVDDGDTWPARLEGLLGTDAVVTNSGVPGFTTFQAVRMAEKHGAEPAPQVAVICAGFNDPGATPQGELPDLERAAKSDADAARPASAFLGLLSDAIAGAQAMQGDEVRPRLSRDDYRETLAAAETYFAERRIPLVWIRWPTQREVERGQAPSGGYPDLLLEHCGQPGVRCVDLMPVFQSLAPSPYYDFVHVRAAGNAAAAETIAGYLRSMPEFLALVPAST